MACGRPRRVAIVGNAGTGKSTLAEDIGRLLGLDPVPLDRLLWKPGWEIVPESEFAQAHDALIRGEHWLFDGLGYPSTLEARIGSADAVIFTRYALWRCYWWALKRELGGRRAGRPGNSAPPPARLVRSIRSTQRNLVPLLDEILERHSATTRVHVLRSPRALPALMAEIRGWSASAA